MAKNITEDDLAAGLEGFGDGFSTITEKRPRRDSPFGAVEPERKAPAEKVVDIRPEKSATPPAADPASEMLKRAQAFQKASPVSPQSNVLAKPAVPQEVEPSPSKEEESEVEHHKAPRTIQEAAREVKVLLHPEAGAGEKPASSRKADIFTERVTVQLSSEMRDAVDTLAKELQRRRTSKEERITANTVLRVAINSLLENFELDPQDSVNTEEELLALANEKLGNSKR